MVFFLQIIMSSYREYEMNRTSMPKATKLLSKVDEIVKKEGSKIMAIRPIIVEKIRCSICSILLFINSLNG